MKKILVFPAIIFFLLFTNSNYVMADKNNARLQAVRQSKKIEGYYLSEALDGETETCSLSVKIRKAKDDYIYTFKIGDKIVSGKVKLIKSDNAKEFGIIFKGIHWAENNGDISNTTQQNKLKLPDGIEGVWSASGIVIQNYGNAMNNYMQIASCGQKYINLVKQ